MEGFVEIQDPEVVRAYERHERLRRRKQMRRQLRELERRLREGCYDAEDWLDDESPVYAALA